MGGRTYIRCIEEGEVFRAKHIDNGENSRKNAQIITSSALQEQSHFIRDDLFIM